MRGFKLFDSCDSSGASGSRRVHVMRSRLNEFRYTYMHIVAQYFFFHAIIILFGASAFIDQSRT